MTCFVEVDKLADRIASVRTRLSRLAHVHTVMYLTMSRYLSRVLVRCQRGTRFVCIVLEETSLKHSRLFRRFRVVYPHKIPPSNTKLSPITLAFHRPYLNGFASFRPAVTPAHQDRWAISVNHQFRLSHAIPQKVAVEVCHEGPL